MKASDLTGRGIIEKVWHAEVLWSQWLVAYLPSDIVTILVAWRVTLWLYPPEVASLPGGTKHLREELRKAGPWTTLEKKTLALMLVGLFLNARSRSAPESPGPLLGIPVDAEAAEVSGRFRVHRVCNRHSTLYRFDVSIPREAAPKLRKRFPRQGIPCP